VAGRSVARRRDGVVLRTTFFSGGWLVALLYSRNEYGNQGPTVAVLTLAALANAWGSGTIHGLRVLEKPDLSFKASLISLGITLVLAMLLIRPLGTLGGACAVIEDDTAAAVVRWLAFSRLSMLMLSRAEGEVEGQCHRIVADVPDTAMGQ